MVNKADLSSGRASLGRILRIAAAAAILPGLDVYAGDSLWNQEIVAAVGPKSDMVECVPMALGSITDIIVDRKNISYQYKIVEIDMTIGRNMVIHGDVRRIGPASAKIAFNGPQAEEPISLKSEISSKLTVLRAAVEAGCAR